MDFLPTPIAGAYEVRLDVRSDARGRFKRHFCERRFAEAGLETRFVQVNHSVTVGTGTLRGLHCQLPPSAEVKLVSCTYGRVFDVAVDLRAGSPSFGAWHGLELDEARAFYIPAGCAHGFQTLSEEAHLVYLHSAAYDPERERGLRFDDPALGIAWPLRPDNLSPRDRALPALSPDFEGITL